MGRTPAGSQREDEEHSQMSMDLGSPYDPGDGSGDCLIEEKADSWCRNYHCTTPSSPRSSVGEESNRFQSAEAESNNADPDSMISSLLGIDMDAIDALRNNPDVLGRSYVDGILTTVNLCASLVNLVARSQKLGLVLQRAARPHAVSLQKLNKFREEGKQLRLKLFALNESTTLHQRTATESGGREAQDAFNDLDAIQLLVSRLLSKMQVLLATAESYHDGGSDWRRVAKAITREATGFTSCTEELGERSLQWRDFVQSEVAVAREKIAGQAVAIA